MLSVLCCELCPQLDAQTCLEDGAGHGPHGERERAEDLVRREKWEKDPNDRQ